MNFVTQFLSNPEVTMFTRLLGFVRKMRQPHGCSALSKPRRPRSWQPRLEELESRDVPSTAIINPVTLSLDVTPTGNEYITLNHRGTFTLVGGSSFLDGSFSSIEFLPRSRDTITINDMPMGTPVRIDPGNGDTINIERTRPNSPVTVNGFVALGGNFTVNITPVGQKLDTIVPGGNVTIWGSSWDGGATLNIYDQEDVIPGDLYSVTDTVVTRSRCGQIIYGPGFGIDSIVQHVAIYGGAGNSSGTGMIYNVDATAAGTPVAIFGGNGNDTFNLTPTSKFLDNIAGALTLDGGTGSDMLNVFDQNDTFADTYTITSSTVTRSFMMGLVTYLDMEGLVCQGGSGNDVYYVESTAARTPVTINAGAGNNHFYVGFSSGFLDAFQGALTLNCQPTSTTLIDVYDYFPGDFFTVTNTSTTLAGLPFTLNYSGMSPTSTLQIHSPSATLAIPTPLTFVCPPPIFP
jgi:hypothetical protein